MRVPDLEQLISDIEHSSTIPLEAYRALLHELCTYGFTITRHEFRGSCPNDNLYRELLLRYSQEGYVVKQHFGITGNPLYYELRVQDLMRVIVKIVEEKELEQGKRDDA